MKISLVIPAYNEEKFIGKCLESVQKNGAGFFEIIVVNNASTDRTAEIAASFPGVRVVTEPSKGLTKARQKGLEEAGGDFIAFIDADTSLPPRWMGMVERNFESPGVVCLSGSYRYYDGPWLRNMFIYFLWWISYPLTYRIVGYMVVGGNFVARRSALLNMGGFDPTIQFHGEDTDIARRISKFGKVIFRMNFFIYTSSRRFNAEGLIKTIGAYVINFLWIVFLHHPLTKTYRDIRHEK